MADVRKTDLPGVGTRFDFTTASGDPLAVLVHRSGSREVLVYDRNDPDRCHTALRLSAEDTLTFVEMLGTSRVVASLAAAQQDLAGLAIDWIMVAPSSRWTRKTLADAAVHTRTGVSILAIIRSGDAIHTPGADTELLAGDRVVAVGTAEGVAQLDRELTEA
ncbi:MAG: TrkA C-terminal domain-containing protein [Acidimicrobiia bacterium]